MKEIVDSDIVIEEAIEKCMTATTEILSELGVYTNYEPAESFGVLISILKGIYSKHMDVDNFSTQDKIEVLELMIEGFKQELTNEKVTDRI